MNKNTDLKKAIEMAIIKPESEIMDSLEPYEHEFSDRYKKEIARAEKITAKKSGKRNISFYYKVSSLIAAALVLVGVLTFTANEKLRSAINNWHAGEELLAPTENTAYTTTVITDASDSAHVSQTSPQTTSPSGSTAEISSLLSDGTDTDPSVSTRVSGIVKTTRPLSSASVTATDTGPVSSGTTKKLTSKTVSTAKHTTASVKHTSTRKTVPTARPTASQVMTTAVSPPVSFSVSVSAGNTSNPHSVMVSVSVSESVSYSNMPGESVIIPGEIATSVSEWCPGETISTSTTTSTVTDTDFAPYAAGKIYQYFVPNQRASSETYTSIKKWGT